MARLSLKEGRGLPEGADVLVGSCPAEMGRRRRFETKPCILACAWDSQPRDHFGCCLSSSKTFVITIRFVTLQQSRNAPGICSLESLARERHLRADCVERIGEEGQASRMHVDGVVA